MGSEHTSISTNGQGDDGADQGAILQRTPSAFVPSPTPIHQGAVSHLPEPGLSSFCCNFNFVCSRNDFLLGLTALRARSIEWKERNMLISSESATLRYELSKIGICAGAPIKKRRSLLMKERQKYTKAMSGLVLLVLN